MGEREIMRLLSTTMDNSDEPEHSEKIIGDGLLSRTRSNFHGKSSFSGTHDDDGVFLPRRHNLARK